MATKDDILMQISAAALAPEAALRYLFPVVTDSSRITICCRRSDYSASAIARAVEDCDAHLLNLNVVATPAPATSDDEFPEPGYHPSVDDAVVELRINHRHAGSVVRSLERYGFRVLAVNDWAEGDPDTTRQRVNEFIRYLNL